MLNPVLRNISTAKALITATPKKDYGSNFLLTTKCHRKRSYGPDNCRSSSFIMPQNFHHTHRLNIIAHVSFKLTQMIICFVLRTGVKEYD
jgi:hypothetical protein